MAMAMAMAIQGSSHLSGSVLAARTPPRHTLGQIAKCGVCRNRYKYFVGSSEVVTSLGNTCTVIEDGNLKYRNRTKVSTTLHLPTPASWIMLFSGGLALPHFRRN